MSRTTLNARNLETLGAERLAALVMELVQGSAALQRRARLALSAAQGPAETVAAIRKRFASLRRTTSFLDARGQRALVADLRSVIGLIEAAVAPQDPAEAFELLWSLLLLAPALHARTDDSAGAIGAVMAEAVAAIRVLAPRLTPDRPTLAERLLEAIAAAGFGEFDGIIPALAEALGPEGLRHLKAIANAFAEATPNPEDLARYRRVGLSALRSDGGGGGPEAALRRDRARTRAIILGEIADLEGDPDAWIARYTPEQLTFGTIAPEAARRLLAAGRPDAALALIAAARERAAGRAFDPAREALDAAYEECLARLGRTEELKQHHWQRFLQTLSAPSLRAHLKLLPDFDDIEAEDAALAHAERHPDLGAALAFLIDWPSHDRAARLVLARTGDLDGEDWQRLSAAADALTARHPLAATLLRRAMITETLAAARTTRYRHAARHLAECAAVDPVIPDHAGHPTHTTFRATLKLQHGRKYGFWELVAD